MRGGKRWKKTGKVGLVFWWFEGILTEWGFAKKLKNKSKRINMNIIKLNLVMKKTLRNEIKKRVENLKKNYPSSKNENETNNKDFENNKSTKKNKKT